MPLKLDLKVKELSLRQFIGLFVFIVTLLVVAILFLKSQGINIFSTSNVEQKNEPNIAQEKRDEINVPVNNESGSKKSAMPYITKTREHNTISKQKDTATPFNSFQNSKNIVVGNNNGQNGDVNNYSGIVQRHITDEKLSDKFNDMVIEIPKKDFPIVIEVSGDDNEALRLAKEILVALVHKGFTKVSFNIPQMLMTVGPAPGGIYGSNVNGEYYSILVQKQSNIPN